MSPMLPFRVLLADYKTAESLVELPHLFVQAGCVVDVFCAKISWLRKNRHYSTWHAATIADPAIYALELSTLARTMEYDWIVLCDESALTVMERFLTDEVLARKILPLSKFENRSLLGSKAALARLSAAHALTSPSSVLIPVDSALDTIRETLSYPLLLKVDRSSGGKGVFLCTTYEELSAALQALPESKRHHLIAQQYIEGDTIAVEALYRAGKLLTHAYSVVTRTTGGDFGVSSVRQYMPFPSIEPDLHRIGDALGINGFCSYTFIRHNGTHYLVEADLRPHMWLTLGQHAGIDFPSAIRAFLTGSSAPQAQPATREVRYFFRDVNDCLARLDVMELLRWLFNYKGRWAYLPLHDAKALRATIVHIARHRLIALRTVLRRHSRIEKPPHDMRAGVN